MAIKLVVLDLDGTLLKNRWKIHPDNLSAIQKCYEKNIKVIIATGRAPITTIMHAQKCQIHQETGHIICYNGGNIIDIKNENMKILYQKPLLTPQIQAVIKFAQEHNFAIWGYSTDNITGFVNKPSLKVTIMENFNHLKKQRVDATTNKIMYKILLFCHKKKQVNPALESLNKISGLEISTSHHNVIEINPLGVNKAVAVQFLCEQWNITADEVLACGDGMNDYKLIQWAKYGIAMKNAHPNLKAVAFDVTDKKNRGGVAKAIEKYIFPKSQL